MMIERLREKYPKFIYKKYFYRISQNNLEIFFDFKIEPSISFKPKIVIENIKKSQIDRIGEKVLNNLVFHLGLIEIPSYWKTTCSPEIIIEASFLNKEQTKWWKDLIMKGMGQFFYENKIDFRQSNFLKINSQGKKDLLQADNAQSFPQFIPAYFKFKNRVLVPIGGGKDSIVTLEKLKGKKEKIGCFLINPNKVMMDIVKVAKIKDSVFIKRKIDPLLFKLNKKGFFNGHTPITAVYSFLSLLAATLFDYQKIAFSNEKSADEGNLSYLGKVVNHQWSKSSDFEKKFRDYYKKYLIKGINYFSFLRNYNESEITKIFTKYPKYFSVFSSCNVVLAKKLKKRWCGNCPKCLFVYASLYPFLDKKQLLKIFEKDIFENRKLLPTMKNLIGQGSHKPFECVGTFRESRTVFQMSLKKAKKEKKIPYLLTKLK